MQSFQTVSFPLSYVPIFPLCLFTSWLCPSKPRCSNLYPKVLELGVRGWTLREVMCRKGEVPEVERQYNLNIQVIGLPWKQFPPDTEPIGSFLGLGLLASSTVRNKMLLLTSSSMCGIMSWQHKPTCSLMAHWVLVLNSIPLYSCVIDLGHFQILAIINAINTNRGSLMWTQNFSSSGSLPRNMSAELYDGHVFSSVKTPNPSCLPQWDHFHSHHS